jgi:hypothetical protein
MKMEDRIHQASVRIDQALEACQELRDHGLMLSDLAKMICEAEHLLSAASFMYDQFYRLSLQNGLVGYRRQERLSRKTRTPECKK